MRVIIDRFEGDFAVCEKEDRSIVNIEKNKLPAGAQPGDVLFLHGDQISFDLKVTKERKKHIEQMMNNLWE